MLDMLLDITCPKMKSGSSVIEKGRSKELQWKYRIMSNRNGHDIDAVLLG